MKTDYNLYENVELYISKEFILTYNGTFILKSRKKMKNLINQILVPRIKGHLKQLNVSICRLIRMKKARLPAEYLITPDNRIIKYNQSVVRQLQEGGYGVNGNVASKRPATDLARPSKRLRTQQVDFSMINLRRDVEFNVTYEIDYGRYKRRDTLRDWLRNVLVEDVDHLIEEQMDRLGRAYPIKIIRVEKTVQQAPEEAIPLLNQRMFGTVVKYHYLQVDENESQTNECVYDFILKNYKIKGLNKAKLLELFNETSSCTGVTTKQIVSFCEKYHIGLYAMDLHLKLYHHFTPVKRSHHHQVLIYVTANQHMYTISNQSVRKSIVAIERVKSSGVCSVGTKSNYSKYNPELPVRLNPRYNEISHLEDTNVIFTNQDCLLDLVIFFFKKENTIYKVESNNSKIKRIHYKNGVDIQINQDFFTVQRDCLKLSIPFKNQTSIHLANEAFDIYKEDDEITSVFNSQTRDLFFNKCKKIPRDHTYYEPPMNANLTAIDIQKCYTAALSIKNEYPWPVYNPFDEVKEYVPSEKGLKNGHYIVDTDDFSVMRGNGMYSRAVLEYCKKVNIPFTIKYEIIPSMTLKKDYFNEFVERLYSKCTDPKFMMNAIIGCLYKKSKVSQKDTFTVDSNDAIRAYYENENTKYDKYGDLYHIKSKTKTELFQNCIPIYLQVLDNAAIEVHKLRVKLGGKLVRIKTDCVVVQDANDVECKPGIGNYRVENLEKFPVFEKSREFINDFKYELQVFQWNNVTGSNSRFLTGLAGSGKSTALKTDIQDLKNCAVIATTNKAARLVGGDTVHSFFGVDLNNKYNESEVIQKASKYNYILLDEVSMLPNKLYELLLLIKMRTKTKIILYGDYKQLKPVKQIKYDYLNSLVVKEIVDFNIEVFEGNKRSGNDMLELYNRIPELKASDFGNKFTSRHICWTHKKRKAINEIMMNRDKKLKKTTAITIEANEYDENSQRVTLVKGAPVMAIRTDKRRGFNNGDNFKVVNLEPLTLKEGKWKIVIDKDIFRDNFYINYCSNIHKLQGDSISVPFTIHEFHRMDDDMKYVAISRTRSKDLINVILDDSKYEYTPDTNHERMMRNKQEDERMKDKLYVRRRDALAVVSKIIKDPKTSDNYCLEHTGLKRDAFLKHLMIENDKLPKGFQVDHIKPRAEHKTDEEFMVINHYTNLRLLSKKENIARNSQK